MDPGAGRFYLEVEDARAVKDPGQQLVLAKRLQADGVDLALINTKKLLGEYSTVEARDLSVRIIEGKIGEGTIKGKVGEVQLPNREQIVEEVRTMLGSMMVEVPEGEIEARCEEFAIAVTASTALHECAHGLVESEPDSKLAQDFEKVSGIENTGGKISTLLDEGIVYAIQRIYAPEVELVGSLAPVARETDDEKVRSRKKLGEKLEPKVKEYFEQEKAIDDEFLSFAATAIKDLGVGD